MQCPSCGKENADNVKFCERCGAAFVSELENPLSSPDPSSKVEASQPFSSLNELPKESNNVEEPFSESSKAVENQVDASVPFRETEEKNDSIGRIADFCPTFAEGLPEWDLTPPNVMIMRGKK